MDATTQALEKTQLPPDSNPDVEQGHSLWQDAWARLSKNRLAVLGGVILTALVIIAILTPWIAPYSYDGQDLTMGATGPSAAHWLGTDTLGRDLLTVCPGIRPAGPAGDDQKRTVDVPTAFAQGADYIVVGRPLRNAPDPRAAADAIVAQIDRALA